MSAICSGNQRSKQIHISLPVRILLIQVVCVTCMCWRGKVGLIKVAMYLEMFNLLSWQVWAETFCWLLMLSKSTILSIALRNQPHGSHFEICKVQFKSAGLLSFSFFFNCYFFPTFLFSLTVLKTTAWTYFIDIKSVISSFNIQVYEINCFCIKKHLVFCFI